jgi:hypothetical protein
MKKDLLRRLPVSAIRLAPRRLTAWATGALALLIAAPLPTSVRASLAVALGLDQLTTLADRVIVGEVLSVRSAWEPGHKRIFTNIEVQVAETWKGGSAVGGKVLIQQPGGRVDDIESRVYGLAEFHTGDRAVLFLKGAERASAVLGLGQGMRPLRFDEAARTWMVQSADRSTAVTSDPRGHFVPSPADPVLPLATLRAQILQLVQR